jgi:hypothetical protein
MIRLRLHRFILLFVIVGMVLALGCASKAATKTAAQPVRPTVPTTPQVIVGFGVPVTATPPPTIPPTLAFVPPAQFAPIAALPTAPAVAQPVVTAAPPDVAARTTIFPTPALIPSDPGNLPLGPGCDNPKVQITYPRDGQAFNLGTSIPVTGTANTNNFLFYKVQYIDERGWNAGDPFAELYANEKDPRKMSGPPKPVIDGLLMTWQSKTLKRGTYYLRLLSTDVRGQYGDTPCTVKVIIR